jgi:hypothetical protein
MQAREKFVSLLEPIIVPTVMCVNKCPSARIQVGKRNVMHRFATLSSAVGGSVEPLHLCPQNETIL